MNVLNAVLAILGTVGVLWGGYTAYIKARGENKSSATEQWKSLYDGQRDEVTSMHTEIAKVNQRMDASVARERIRDDYIQILRQHIADGRPPPPPAWPAELLAIRGSDKSEG